MAGLAVTGAVEVDVRMTGDGHPVLAHDPVVEGAVIAETTWVGLATTEETLGHPLCQLDAVMAIPGRLDLEVKNLPGQPGFDPSGRLALEVAARARVSDVVTSFYWPDMDLVRRRAPDVTTGLLVGEGGSLSDAVDHATERGHGIVAAHHSLVTPTEAERLATRDGPALIVWTLDDFDRAVALVRSGVAAVVTDRPSALFAFMQEETSG